MKQPGSGPRTLYDLTPSQRLSFLNLRWTVHKQVVNIATSVVVEAELDRHRLEAALRLAILRWDAFGLRFVKDGKGHRQYFGDRAALSIEHRDFRGSDAPAMEAFFLGQAARKLPLVESPQSRFVLFVTPEGHSGVFSVVSHLIMDSWAISRFYLDVMDVYWALDQGEALPRDPRPSEPVLAAEIAYQGSERCLADRRFWEEELNHSQPEFVSILGSSVLAEYRAKKKQPDAYACGTAHLRTKADHVVTTVAAEDVAAFTAFLSEHGVASLQVLFHLALRLYLAKVNGRNDDLMVGVNVARRATLAEKNSGGSRVQHIKFRVVMPEETTFVDALHLLMEKQNLYFRHMDYSSYETQFMGHQAFGTRPGTGYYDIHLTFQPLPMEVGHGLVTRTRWYCNGATSLPAYLTVMDDDGSGGLRCYWERNVRHMPAEALLACHAYMVKAMRAGVERPSITVGELLDLD